MPFDDLYRRWRGVPFPHGSHRDDVDELHADLALVDTWVAETVVPYVERGLIAPPPKVDIGAGVQGIRNRVRVLRDGATGEELAILNRYMDYVDLIDELYVAFRKEHPEQFT